MIPQTSFRRTLLSGLLISTLTPTLASAAGFALIENNARGQGNAYAGAAAYTPDASTVFFNPAGLTDLEGEQIVVAGHYIIPHSRFNDEASSASALFAGSPFAGLTGDEDDGGSPAVVPNFYWSKTIDETKTFGFGFNAPFGLATKYDDDWVGRYHAVVSDLQIVNFNPSLGYKVNDNLSLGGGVDMMLAHVQLTQAIDFGAICLAQFTSSICQGLGALPQQADGFGDLEGDNFDDVALGYNLGLKYKLSDTSSLGITYRSEVDIDVDGDADFSVPAAGAFVFAGNLFLDTGLEASVTLPASFSISYANQVDNITYLADITWTGWSSFEELRIEYDNSNQPTTVNTYAWEDVYRYSFGIDYQYSDDTVYRFGLALDESPVPSPERRTPRLPGNDRTWVSFGVSKQLDNSMSIDVGYSHLFIDDAEIENEVESSIPTLASTLDGEYEASVDIFSVQLTWQY